MAVKQTTPKTWVGRGPTIEAATDKAWGSAKRAKQKPGWYYVLSIQFRAENPIGEYRVVIGGGP